MKESLVTTKVDVGGVGRLESTVHFLVRADRTIDLALVNKGQILVLIVVFIYFRHFAVFPFDIRS